MAETRIEVTRRRLHRRGGRFEWYWHYYVKGPDTHVVGGRVIPRRFDNRSIVELRRVLKRHYGRDVRIVEDVEGGEVMGFDAELEKAIDRRVQRRLQTDPRYRYAESAEAQSAAEETITREVERELGVTEGGE